jgi:hypothetical protein
LMDLALIMVFFFSICFHLPWKKTKC